MIMIKDYDSFLVSSLLAKLREKNMLSCFSLMGKKIIDSLFLIEVIDKNLFRCPPLSSLWLKIVVTISLKEYSRCMVSNLLLFMS